MRISDWSSDVCSSDLERSPILTTPAAAIEPAVPPEGVPAETIKLSSMRKTIARRLAQSKQQIPHIYLTVDIRLDSLLTLLPQINDELGDDGMKVSVNDWLIIDRTSQRLNSIHKCASS